MGTDSMKHGFLGGPPDQTIDRCHSKPLTLVAWLFALKNELSPHYILT